MDVALLPIPELRINLITIVLAVGVVQALSLAPSLLLRRDPADRPAALFAVLMLIFGLLLLDLTLSYSYALFRMLWLVDFSEPLTLCIGPLLYAYQCSVLHPDRPLPRAWLHIVLPSIYLLNHVFFLAQPADVKYLAFADSVPELGLNHLDVHQAFDADPLGMRQYVNPLWLSQFTVYLALMGWQLVREYRSRSEAITQLSLSPALNWLRVFWLIGVSVLILHTAARLSFPRDAGDFIIGTLMTLIAYAAGVALLRPGALPKHDPITEAVVAAERVKYQKSGLTNTEVVDLAKKLEVYMAAERPYRQPTLTRERLAEAIGTTPYHLSQVLSEGLGSTFFDYLARWRIADAAERLRNPAEDALTVEAIGEFVGYNAKSSFYQAFKKVYSVTPAEFRRAARAK